MVKQITSVRRAKAFATALFLIGLAIVAFTGQWWPGIILAIGIPMALKQFLVGRPHDLILTLLVFGGVFITYQYEVNWQMLLPILFVVAAVYVLFREFSISAHPTTEEEDEDRNHEIEEDETHLK